MKRICTLVLTFFLVVSSVYAVNYLALGVKKTVWQGLTPQYKTETKDFLAAFHPGTNVLVRRTWYLAANTNVEFWVACYSIAKLRGYTNKLDLTKQDLIDFTNTHSAIKMYWTKFPALLIRSKGLVNWPAVAHLDSVTAQTVILTR